MSSDWIVDTEHVNKLEAKLKAIKDRPVVSKDIIVQLNEWNNYQLCEDRVEQCFEDNFVEDKVIDNHWVKQKIVPEKCAVSTSELLTLPENDSLEQLQVKYGNVDSTLALQDLIDKGPQFQNDFHMEMVHCIKSGDRISVVWMVFDHDMAPLYTIISMFQVYEEDCIAILIGQKFADSPVSMSQFIETNGNEYVVYFYQKGSIEGYLCDDDDFKALEDITTISKVFENFPTDGFVIRSKFFKTETGHHMHCFATEKGRFCVSLASEEKLLDRHSILYSSLISVLEMIRNPAQDNVYDLILSATSGPPEQWALEIIDGKIQLSQEYAFELWNEADAIVSSGMNDDKSEMAIGTFSGDIFIYTRTPMETTLDHTFQMFAPVIGVQYINKTTLAILTSQGLQVLRRVM
uniref:Kaptin n=1 Tax=Rhabditophanes sp. KR3021 TaxID=114890 RepID=A0AC35TVI4_9BILA